jgi:hypothetical protein
MAAAIIAADRTLSLVIQFPADMKSQQRFAVPWKW